MRTNTEPTTPLVLFLVILLFYKQHKFNISSELKLNTNQRFLTCFVLPPRKKKIIFLRAPYKNKLARLNLVRVSKNFKINVLFTCGPQVLINNVNMRLKLFTELNLSSTKLKHVKSVVNYPTRHVSNFIVKNYL